MGVDKVYAAVHRGMVGSDIVRTLQLQAQYNLVIRTHFELDRSNQAAVQAFFEKEKPTQAVHAQRVDHIYQYAHEH